jgi:hypothetical protein
MIYMTKSRQGRKNFGRDCEGLNLILMNRVLDPFRRPEPGLDFTSGMFTQRWAILRIFGGGMRRLNPFPIAQRFNAGRINIYMTKSRQAGRNFG